MHALKTIAVKWPFIGLQISNAATNLGHALAAVLYPWVMYQISGSILWTTAIAAITVSLLLIGLIFGGYLADLVGFRDVALSASNLAAVMALAVAALYAADLLTPKLFLILAVIGRSLDGPATIAVEARLKEIARLSKVSRHHANLTDDIIDAIVLVGAPAIASFMLVTAGVLGLMWAIAALTVFALAFLSLSLPRFRLAATPRFRDTFDSLRWFIHATSTPNLLIGSSFAVAFFITMHIFLVPVALGIDDMPIESSCLFLSAAAAGMIVVNLILTTKKTRHLSSDALVAPLLGLSGSAALLAFNMSPLMLLVSGLLAGFSAGFLSPVYAAMPQTKAPRHLRSTALGLAYATLLFFLPAEMLVAGILIYTVSVKAAFVISAVGLLMVALIYHCWFAD